MNTSLPVTTLALSLAFLGAPRLASAQDIFPSLPQFELQPDAGPLDGEPVFDFGDLDGDDRVDALVQVRGVGEIAAILQQADGTWAVGPILDLGKDPDVLRLAHLDGDGVLDVVLATNAVPDGVVDIGLGNGDGSFTLTDQHAVGDGVFDIEIGDLDGDGVLDLVALSRATDSFAVLLGQGDGGFDAPVVTPTGTFPEAIALGDVNDDDVLDLVFARTTFTGRFTVWLGGGDGSFTETTQVLTGGLPIEVQLGDLDGNGTLDVIIGREDEATLATWAPGVGDGTFSAPIDPPFLGSGDVLRLADLDEDGDEDLVFRTGPGVPGLAAALNSGDGTFAEALSVAVAGGDFEVRDVTGDGDLDLVSAWRSFTNTVVEVAAGSGRGTFLTNWGVSGGVEIVLLADLDDDGLQDLVLPTNGMDELKLFQGQPGGFFEEVGAVVIPNLWNRTGTIADLDGDGVPDYVAQTRLGNDDWELSVWFGFVVPQVLPVQGYISDVVAADVDGDDDVDLIANRGVAVRVMLNNGSGGFGNAASYPVDGAGGDLAYGDFTGDGIGDIAATDKVAPEGLIVLPGLGGGVFGPALVTTTAVDDPLAAADFDEDGTLDLVAPVNVLTTRVHLNQGDGTFGASVDLSATATPEGLDVGDFDGDGHMDVVLAYGAKVQLHLGDGAGGFAPPEIYDVRPLNGVRAGDVDGDGTLDLRTEGASTIQVLLNRNGPWTNAGAPLAGEQGLPKLVGSGSLVAGDTFRQTFTDARPSALTSWYLGISELSASFKGGVFVPSPDLLVPVVTDAAGDWTFAFEWPAGLGGGFPLWFQVWLIDPAGVFGFASSNGLRVDVP